MQVSAQDLARAEAGGASGALPDGRMGEISPDTATEEWLRVAAALGVAGSMLDAWQESGPSGLGTRFRLADLVVDYMAAREAVFNADHGLVGLALARLTVHDLLDQVTSDVRQLDGQAPSALVGVAESYLREDPFAATAAEFVATATLDANESDPETLGLEVVGAGVFGAGSSGPGASVTEGGVR